MKELPKTTPNKQTNHKLERELFVAGWSDVNCNKDSVPIVDNFASFWPESHCFSSHYTAIVRHHTVHIVKQNGITSQNIPCSLKQSACFDKFKKL